MIDTERFKLPYGPYKTPRCRLGKKLYCHLRGWVTFHHLSDGPIPWPMTRPKRRPAVHILCGDLVRAVRKESNIAVCHHWDVSASVVSGWRKALDVPRSNKGTTRLFAAYAPERFTPEGTAKGVAATNTPEAIANRAAKLRGRPMHPNARAALEEHRVLQHTAETRRKMSDTHKKRGTMPVGTRVWTEEELALLDRMPDEALAARINRSVHAIQTKRFKLKKHRLKGHRAKGGEVTR